MSEAEAAAAQGSGSLTMSRVTIDGMTIAYRRAGVGPSLVLLHGFTQDSRVWRPQLEGLADAFTVVAWDAPGAGQSDDPPEPYGIDRWAECLARFLDAVGIDDAAVCGLSWGGLLAQELYRRHPAKVDSLILADTYAGWTGSLGRQSASERLAACIVDSSLPPAEFVPRYLPGMFGPAVPSSVRDELAAIMADTHPHGFRLMATALAQADTRDLLPRIDVPTLLVWGDADVRSPIAIAWDFHRAIRDSAVVVVPGAGHVSNLERPDVFNEAVRGLLVVGH
jgi:pimeloyl-ACP methyl ester carboxylesterase